MEFTSWNPNELYHYGTKGMRWGQRRFQNDDGSLTPLGRERYGKHSFQMGRGRSARGMARDLNKLDKEQVEARYRARQIGRLDRVESLERKLQRANNAGKYVKADNIKNKIQKLKNLDPKKLQKMQEYNKLAQKSKSLSDRILSIAKKRGYKIDSKEVKRRVQSNRDKVLSALSTLGSVAIATGTAAAGIGPKVTISRMIRPNTMRITTHQFGLATPVFGFGGRAKGRKYSVKRR